MVINNKDPHQQEQQQSQNHQNHKFRNFNSNLEADKNSKTLQYGQIRRDDNAYQAMNLRGSGAGNNVVLK